MSTYDSLTDQQKEFLAIADKSYRGVFSSLVKVFRESDAASLNQWITDHVDPIITSLDAGEVIPNATDLAGSIDLTKEEFLALQAIARGLVATKTDPTNAALLAKAVGVNA